MELAHLAIEAQVCSPMASGRINKINAYLGWEVSESNICGEQNAYLARRTWRTLGPGQLTDMRPFNQLKDLEDLMDCRESQLLQED